MTQFNYSPISDGTTGDVADVNGPFADAAAVINGGIDNTNITPGSLQASAFTASANPETRYKEQFANFVVSGLTIGTSGTLGSTVATGVAYVNGKRLAPGAYPKTFTASKDTYVDLKDDGTYAFVEVANGATVGMTLSTNTDGSSALRIAKVVTSGTAVTAVTQTGQDPLGNTMYSRSPLLRLGVGGVVTGETTTSTSYVQLATTTDVVSILVGPSGFAQVTISSSLSNSNAAAGAQVGFAVSGATTVAASDAYSISYIPAIGTQTEFKTGSWLVSGLTPGLNTFGMRYKVGANTGTFTSRRISVEAK